MMARLRQSKKIYDEPENDLESGAYQLYLEALGAINNYDGLSAEQLLNRALEIVPDSLQLTRCSACTARAINRLRDRLKHRIAPARLRHR
ncbi:MAG: hypothetical protein J2P31_08750 [Blastocatellia bacterium]|nr:hypothetical protein [Blastocatellia bacterium]